MLRARAVQKSSRTFCFGIKSEKTSESNRLADSARKKRLSSYFTVAATTSNFILHIYNALDVSSQKIELIW